MKSTTKVGFLGAGNMAEAFCRGLLAKKVLSLGNLCASDIRPASQIPWLKELKVRSCGAVQAVADSDVLFLAVKPKDMAGLLQSLPGRQGRQKLFISIAAGVPLRKIEALLGPGSRVVRVMPNTPALVGMGASAYCLGKGALASDARLVENLLSAVGLVVRVRDENELDAVTAVSGSGPAYVFRFLEDLQAAGEKAGLRPGVSFQLAAQTLRGAAEMAQRAGSAEAVGVLREKVTSPGGTTAAALAVLEKKKFGAILEQAVMAARARSRELGRIS